MADGGQIGGASRDFAFGHVATHEHFKDVVRDNRLAFAVAITGKKGVFATLQVSFTPAINSSDADIFAVLKKPLLDAFLAQLHSLLDNIKAIVDSIFLPIGCREVLFVSFNFFGFSFSLTDGSFRRPATLRLGSFYSLS